MKEKCLKGVNLTSTPATPIFTINLDNKNNEGGKNGNLYVWITTK